MSWSIFIAGRDKEKLKQVVRDQQSKDEFNEDGSRKPWFSGMPKRSADFICDEIDRVRIYDFNGRAYGVLIDASGHHSEQDGNENFKIRSVQLDQ